MKITVYSIHCLISFAHAKKKMWARSIYPPSAWTRTLHYGSEAPAEASQLYKVWIWNAEPSLLAPGSIVASNALLALGKLAVFNSPSVQLGSKLSYIHLILGHFHIGCSRSIWAQWISYKSHSLHVPADFRKQVTPWRHLALHTEKEAPSANEWRHLVFNVVFWGRVSTHFNACTCLLMPEGGEELVAE